MLHPECSCCFLPSDANRGPAAQGGRIGGVILSVTPQQAAVVLELGACFNYCIISPPTLSLTSGPNEGPEHLKILNVLYFKTVKSPLAKKQWNSEAP